MADEAWAAQAETLQRVQREGSRLEKTVRDIVGWAWGRVVYDPPRGYDLQVDAAHPSAAAPQVVLSTTQTKPDTRGHSNENKFQLKLGELALLKCAHRGVAVVLAIGGSGEDWSPYVLRAFHRFYDEVLFLWEDRHVERLREIGENPSSVPLRNTKLWDAVGSEWAAIDLLPDTAPIPKCLVRYDIADVLRAQEPRVSHPALLENEIARLCMQRSYDKQGKEWRSYTAGSWERIEMSRSFFNPLEATVEIGLQAAGVRYEGGVGSDVQVPSLLHKLGMSETRVSEDFVTRSMLLDMPVYIQCKSSGGGRQGHGKNIQNRTKEQIARSLIYRCGLEDGQITWQDKHFHWVGVLDGNWRLPKKHPTKYVHMLQWAGYDRIFAAADLLSDDLQVRREDNPVTRYLIDELGCETV